jgi:excisionase family DNA binding protein
VSVVDAAERQLARVAEVARFLNVSRSKVYQMMDAGELAYVKLGKSRRVRWSDVQRLVDQNVVARS